MNLCYEHNFDTQTGIVGGGTCDICDLETRLKEAEEALRLIVKESGGCTARMSVVGRLARAYFAKVGKE